MILHYSFQFDSISSNVQAGDLAAMVLVSQQGAFQTSKSSLAGYYAQVNLKNNSSEYVELFSAGSQVSESSK
jgi:hypothetical protein